MDSVRCLLHALNCLYKPLNILSLPQSAFFVECRRAVACGIGHVSAAELAKPRRTMAVATILNVMTDSLSRVHRVPTGNGGGHRAGGVQHLSSNGGWPASWRTCGDGSKRQPHRGGAQESRGKVQYWKMAKCIICNLRQMHSRVAIRQILHSSYVVVACTMDSCAASKAKERYMQI